MLFSSFIPLNGVDIPVYAGLQSSNNVDWYPERPIKDLSWGEKYKFLLGIDEIQKGDWSFKAGIAGQPWHTEFQVVIDHLMISYSKGPWELSGMTIPDGIGWDYAMQQLMVDDPGFDGFLFDAHRFNGISVQHTFPFVIASLAWGGNNRKQAILSAELDGELDFVRYIGGIKAVTQDTHWNSPAIQSSIGMELALPSFGFKTDLVWNHMISYRDRPRRDEYFIAGELYARPISNLIVHWGGTHTRREFYPFESSRFSLSAGISFGKVDLVPMLDLHYLDKDRIQSTGLLGQWHLNEFSRVGPFYRYCKSNKAEGYHVFGLQSDLRLSF